VGRLAALGLVALTLAPGASAATPASSAPPWLWFDNHPAPHIDFSVVVPHRGKCFNFVVWTTGVLTRIHDGC
jgi:hypothetical protein